MTKKYRGDAEAQRKAKQVFGVEPIKDFAVDVLSDSAVPRFCFQLIRVGDTALASGYGWEEGELVSILQDMIRGTMLPVDDPENPDRTGDLQGIYDVMNGCAFGKRRNLLIGAELAQ